MPTLLLFLDRSLLTNGHDTISLGKIWKVLLIWSSVKYENNSGSFSVLGKLAWFYQYCIDLMD